MKKYYCLDCDTKVSDYRIKRCKQCSLIYINKTKKSYPKCKDCKKELTRYGNLRCKACDMKNRRGEKHWNYKHGETLKKHYCSCGKEIKYVSKRCASCAGIYSILKKRGRNHHMFGKLSPHGRGEYYKNIWMRSSWEVAYAKYLDKQGTKWSYESITYALGDTTYTPDFYLSESDTYIEIKGYWRDDAKKKFRLFKKLFPQIKIEVLTRIKLGKIGIKV